MMLRDARPSWLNWGEGEHVSRREQRLQESNLKHPHGAQPVCALLIIYI